MEENAKNEQFLEIDEEQMQAVTGAGQPNEKTSPITFNRWMADQLFQKATKAHERGFTSLGDTIAENAIKHLDRAEQLTAEKAAGKQPIVVSKPTIKPKPGSSNGTLKIYG
jgi:hypothetical protein